MTFEEFKYNNNQFILNYYPTSITLNVTNNCNLKCRYCFVNQNENHMSLDIAQKSIDFLYNNYKNNKTNEKMHVLFFGGEPLLEFKTIIKPLIEDYIEKKYNINLFSFSITTNGTLLTESICNFLKKYDFNIQISFDGIKQIQNYNRPFKNKNNNSYDIIIKNLQENIFYNNKLQYIIRATFNLDNIDLWFDNFIFFESLPIKAFTFSLEYYKNIPLNLLLKCEEQIDLICDLIFDRIKREQRITKFEKFYDYLSLLLEHDYNLILNNQYNNINFNNICNFCGYGLNYVAIDYKGNIYPCHEEITEYKDENFTCIGNIFSGINKNQLLFLREQIQKIEYNFIQNRICFNECWFKEQKMPCQYITCPAHALKINSITYGECIIDMIFCQKISQHLNQIINIEKNDFFINYLKQYFPIYNFIYQYLHAPAQIQPSLIQIEKERTKNE